MADLLKKISDLTAGTPLDTDVIPYVDLVAGSTKKALKSELKGDTGDTGAAATADAGTTTTLAAGASATVVNSGSTSAAVFDFGIPQGIAGTDGACVSSVAFVGNDMVFTLDDASTVTLTDAKLDLKGDTGATGAVIESAAFVGDDLVFTLSDASTVTLTGALTSLKGDTGDTGATGPIGMDWQGAWSAGTYTLNQGVENNGSSFIVNTTSTSEEPSVGATDWDLVALKGTDGAGSGTVTSVAALTLGTTGTDLSSTVADGTTTPVITLQVPTASSSNRGALSSTDWSTFNGKQDALGYTAENSANKENSTIDTSTTKYPTVNLLKTGLDAKASLTGTETLTNKTLTSPVISSISNTGTLTLPTSTDTLVGRATTDTLTNKTLTTPKIAQINDTNGNEALKLSATSSAVNEITIKNEATGNAPEVQATGGDTNIDLKLTPKGTGGVTGRMKARVGSTTSSATPTINTDNYDVYRITALAVDITSMTTNLSGTPTHGQKLIIEITGTAARAITWGASFEASTVALPTTTVTTAMLSVGFVYNSGTSKWRCLASA